MARGRGSYQKKIDTVHWTEGGWTFGALAAGAVGGITFAAQHLPETLLRIRGEWAAWFDGALSSGEGVSVTAGLILVPEGTGSTVLWSPVTDGDAPWIWWDSMLLAYEEPVVDTIAIQAMLGRARVIDSKAMRKVRNTELQAVVENTTRSGFNAATVHCCGEFRGLAGS